MSHSGSTLHSDPAGAAVVTRRRGESSGGMANVESAISASPSAAATRIWTRFFASGSRVVALPPLGHPRLFIPADGFLGRWTASRLYPAFRPTARIYRLFLRILATLSLLPSRSTPQHDGAFEDLVKELLPDCTAFSLLIGTPGPGQKLTIECRDAARRVIGYVKYAGSAVARRQLRHESDILRSLPAGTGPELVAITEWQNAVLQWTRPVAGRPVPASIPPPPSLADFVRSLVLAGTEMEIELHPWSRRTHGYPDVIPILDRLRGRPWPVAIQHGDLAAWNLRSVRGGALQAFDWEYGSLEGLPCLDPAQFVLQHAALIARNGPGEGRGQAAEYLRSVVDSSLSAAEADALVRLAAFDAYLNDPSPDSTPLQQWRQGVWRGLA